MTEGPGATGAPHHFTDKELAWIREHLTELRRSVTEQRILQPSLAIGFVVGLAAHVAGYLLKTSAMTEPFALAADLLYALGWALWTGVVVALFVQVLPEAKRRQIKRALDAYDAALRARGQPGGNVTSRDEGAPTSSQPG